MCSQRLSPTPRGARLARILAVAQLIEWGFPHDSPAVSSGAALVAELAANAVTHGRVPGRDFEFRITLAPRTLRIEVADARSERRPSSSLAPPPPDAESGRGLLVVAALSSRWGVDEREGPGKTVWAELDR
ncbi:ATP-binding protein [Streptomyces sp. NPDC002994]|uniref:ATP-binding protein n=1 Tax=Streptomyces sp. NPDC002994 TaxID=3154441 RepID=UPI0033ABD799